MPQVQSHKNQNLIAVAQTAISSYPLPNEAEDLELLRQDVIQVLRLAQIGDAEKPFGKHIEPGQSVVIKPNWVKEDDGSWSDSLITHSSLIAVTVSLVQQALQGRGAIAIADAPIQGADWEKLMSFNRIHEYLAALRQPGWLPVNIIDLRMVRTRFDSLGKRTMLDETPGDPLGYCLIDLKEKSALEPISGASNLFEVSGYDQKTTINSHGPGKHQYLISKTVLTADVVINMPKLKTHKKAGMTCCLKNIVGVNGKKEFLPHHRRGSSQQGGDEYPGWILYNVIKRNTKEAIAAMPTPIGKLVLTAGMAFKMAAYKYFKMTTNKTPSAGRTHFDIGEGSWYGNDTIWRTVNDLTKILIYYDKNGLLKNEKQRVQINLIDAIIAGEGEGPLEPTAKSCGCIIAGLDAVAVDSVSSWFMGFNHEKIPLIRESLANGSFPLTTLKYEDIEVIINDQDEALIATMPAQYPAFKAPAGWAGHIELGS